MPLPRISRRACCMQAIALYRQNFRPSATLAKPYVTIGVPLIAAPTDDEAEYLATSVYQRILALMRGQSLVRSAHGENDGWPALPDEA